MATCHWKHWQTPGHLPADCRPRRALVPWPKRPAAASPHLHRCGGRHRVWFDLAQDYSLDPLSRRSRHAGFRNQWLLIFHPGVKPTVSIGHIRENEMPPFVDRRFGKKPGIPAASSRHAKGDVSQVLPRSDSHLHPWPAQLFGDRPFHRGKGDQPRQRYADGLARWEFDAARRAIADPRDLDEQHDALPIANRIAPSLPRRSSRRSGTSRRSCRGSQRSKNSTSVLANGWPVGPRTIASTMAAAGFLAATAGGFSDCGSCFGGSGAAVSSPGALSIGGMSKRGRQQRGQSE